MASITFVTNSFITAIDTSLVRVINMKDSVSVNDYSYKTEYNTLMIELDKSAYSELEFHFLENAILTDAGGSEEQKINCTLNEERKYGSLKLNLSYYPTSSLLQIYLLR